MDPVNSVADLQLDFESPTPAVNQTIAPGEQMPHAHRQHYFSVGEGVIRLIKLALLASRKRPDSVKNILDMPCGHGRVMRSIRAAFPDARITACDLLKDGVDFCAATFNAIPVYSNIHPTREMFPDAGKYDLIFVGSLFTHLNAKCWAEFLPFFESLLAPDGILLFTTHGPFVAYRFEHGEAYGYSDRHLDSRTTSTGSTRVAEHITSHYRNSGFAYLDDGTGYGISVSKPAWTMAQVDAHTSLRVLYYLERGWDNHQDACALINRPFTTVDADVGHPFLVG